MFTNGQINLFLKERNHKPVSTHGREEAARRGHPGTDEPTQATQKDDTRSSSSVGAREEVDQGVSADDESGVVTKPRKVVTKPLGRVPSLALDGPATEDGVLQRPYENRINNGRDASPDRNDSDSVSAYEDASAETPEKDNVFPGEDALELPDDSESKDKNPSDNSLVSESKTENPKTAEACVVS